MKIAPLAARCACGRTGPDALAPLFRDNIRAMTTAAHVYTAEVKRYCVLIFETSIKKIAVAVAGVLERSTPAIWNSKQRIHPQKKQPLQWRKPIKW